MGQALLDALKLSGLGSRGGRTVRPEQFLIGATSGGHPSDSGAPNGSPSYIFGNTVFATMVSDPNADQQ